MSDLLGSQGISIPKFWPFEAKSEFFNRHRRSHHFALLFAFRGSECNRDLYEAAGARTLRVFEERQLWRVEISWSRKKESP